MKLCDQTAFMDITGSPTVVCILCCTSEVCFYGIKGLQKQTENERHFIEEEQEIAGEEGGREKG